MDILSTLQFMCVNFTPVHWPTPKLLNGPNDVITCLSLKRSFKNSSAPIRLKFRLNLYFITSMLFSKPHLKKASEACLLLKLGKILGSSSGTRVNSYYNCFLLFSSDFSSLYYVPDSSICIFYYFKFELI